MDLLTFCGSLLITCASISFAFGLYATNAVFKTAINRLLMIICTAFGIWSMGHAIISVAASAEIRMIGYLIAPIGWGPLPGLLLNFTLLVTEKEGLLRKWWIYPLLYLPGLATLVAYTAPIIGGFAGNFAPIKFGPHTASNIEIWSYIFYVYQLGFMAVNVILLLTARRTSRTKDKRAQITLLALSYILACIFAILSDIVIGNLDILIPRYSIFFFLIPLGVSSYIVKKYGSAGVGNGAIKGKEYSEVGPVHSRAISVAFVIGSILNIVSQKLLYSETGVSNIDGFSIYLLATALFILVVSKLEISGIIKEMAIAIVYSFLVPYITLRYVQYGSITIWSFVFILFTICLLYNRQILLITISVSAIMTQLIVWAISPVVYVKVDMADYIVRLGLIGISAFFSIYINAIYTSKLKENSIYSYKEVILSEVTGNFISASEWNKDEVMYDLLEKCGSFIGADRAYITLFEPTSKEIQASCEWVDEGIQSEMDQLKSMDPDMFQRLLAHFGSGRVIKLHDSHLLPPTVGVIKRMLSKQNIRGMVNLPVMEKNELIGMMGFNSSRPLSEWNLDTTDFLEIVANVAFDMLQKIKAEERYERLAYYDQLTQLPNRVLYMERLDNAIIQAKATKKMVGVVFMDIDSFKTINDTMGHDFGDKVLYEVGQMLSHNIRDCDTVARLGGDEFIFILEMLSTAKDATKIMNNLVSAAKHPIVLDGQNYYVTISAGVALYPQDGGDSDTLVKAADTALYAAKEKGKNRYIMCSQDMKAQVTERLMLTNNLYHALEKEQLMLYYQPQIDINTNKIVGFEALLRWSLPEKGMIAPNTFIPLAEQTRLINPIGAWVLETACFQNKMWQDKGYTGMRMAVNISVFQLNTPGFVQQVRNILKRTGLSPEYLELEITESALSLNEINTVKVLSDMKELGITISIDDFGTEYSSLKRIKYLPIDRIKVDIEFVHGIDLDEKDRAITKLIISFAKSMNLNIIAEGVETKSQLDFLSQRMCDEVQGYYYYRPMPAEEVEKILSNYFRDIVKND